MKTLEIIIVSYNSLVWLQKTLDSLNEFYLPDSKYNVTVTVVDNASTDQTVQFLQKSYQRVNLIKSVKNVGFSAGNNLALKLSRADFIMLLNSDMELTEKSKIDELIDYIESNPDTGIITPKIMLADGKIDKACHRGEPGVLDAFFYFAGFEKIFPRIKIFTKYHLLYKDLSSIHEVDAVTGACMIMKNNILQQIGYFDEQFFMYSEDMDLCRRFREKGFKIIFYPYVEIIHHKYKSGLSSTDAKIKTKISNHFYKSFLLYYDKYYKSRFYYKLVRLFLHFFVWLKVKKEG
ncbi:MAG: glycosyltransferase family 2 protein [Endomicrobiaceae bacterium]|nr:glycosyltransferase family 2 protein [Endomicrobiaceae bacterium]